MNLHQKPPLINVETEVVRKGNILVMKLRENTTAALL